MRIKFVFIYLVTLAIATVISIIILSFQNIEIHFLTILKKFYLLLLYFKFPFYPAHPGSQVLLYLASPLLITFLLPKTATNRQISMLRNLGYSLKMREETNVDFLNSHSKFKKQKLYCDPKVRFTEMNVDIISEVSKRLEEFQGHKEVLEGTFNLKFSDALIIIGSKKITYRLIIDRFAEIDANNIIPEKPFHSYVGKNSSDQAIYTSNEHAPFLMVIGGSGSGKTTFLASKISQDAKLYPSSTRILIDPKGMDFPESLVKSLGIVYIDASSSEGRKQALEILKDIRDKCRGENKEFLRSHGFNHAQRAFEQGLQTPLGQIFLYIDEFGRLLTNETASFSAEEKLVLKSISEIVNDLLSTARSHGLCICLLNQRLHLSQITINPDNIMSIMMNGVAKEIASKYEAPIGREPVKGRWYLINETVGNQFIKTPTKRYE